MTRNTVRRQAGLGNISGPEEGTSTIEKRQRSVKMKGTSTVELQMELQRHVSQKKVLQESLLCVDWQRYSKQFHEDIRTTRLRFEFFFQMSVSYERDHWKELSKHLET